MTITPASPTAIHAVDQPQYSVAAQSTPATADVYDGVDEDGVNDVVDEDDVDDDGDEGLGQKGVERGR